MAEADLRQNPRLPGFIRALLDPDRYSPPVAGVRLVQTHISLVIVAGDYVYKWKKPVNFGFVDFSTLAKREFYCRREVELNRRLCPDIYLGVVAATRSGNGFALGGDGAVVEYGVMMRRMPEEGMLDRVIAAGGLGRDHLQGIVDILVPFYRRAQHGRRVRNNGRVAAIARTLANNFQQSRPFVGSEALPEERFTRICAATDRVLAHEELFAERRRKNRIRDCHGDLYSHNICLGEGGRIHIFDCLEFNDGLRHIDVCADIAFLAMDLEYHGLMELSDFFVRRFVAQSGDVGLLQLLEFYKCYRACVRGKVGLLSAVDPAMPVGQAAAAREAAARYFLLAEEYARGF